MVGVAEASVSTLCPLPGPEAGLDVTVGGGGGGPMKEDSGLGGGVGGLPASLCAVPGPWPVCSLLGSGGRLTVTRVDSECFAPTSLCII